MSRCFLPTLWLRRQDVISTQVEPEGADPLFYLGIVLIWAVTKAGSRRRRGYNVDSSWTEAALSRWLVPHGRSAS